MDVHVYSLNSFVKGRTGGGNPTGVVLIKGDGHNGTSVFVPTPLTSRLSSSRTMQRVAKMAGFSETAFVRPSGEKTFDVRFFTPTQEVDLCGHATLAWAYFLSRRGLESGTYYQQTKARSLPLEVRITDDGPVFMEQTPPRFYDVLDRRIVAECLRFPEEALMVSDSDQRKEELPIQIVSTGMRDIFVPVRDLQTLSEMKPDLDAIAQLTRQHHADGLHAFTLQTKYGSTAHSRNFAPACGIPEEAATGSSTGALACFLFQHGALGYYDRGRLTFEQGCSMGKPSEILAWLVTQNSMITNVYVGGTAQFLEEKVITVRS